MHQLLRQVIGYAKCRLVLQELSHSRRPKLHMDSCKQLYASKFAPIYNHRVPNHNSFKGIKETKKRTSHIEHIIEKDANTYKELINPGKESVLDLLLVLKVLIPNLCMFLHQLFL